MTDTGVDVRPFEPFDADALWELKRGFETGLGAGTGGEAKAEAYEAKLDQEYRSRWLAWVDDCVSEGTDCVSVAARERRGDETGDELAGYVFLLPESMAFVWDAAVLNELYVEPDARGTGVADDLMDAALAAAREQDTPLDRLVLDVDSDNQRAKAFYERHGFDDWGEMVARRL
ncbi:GNAT family N-acetyltransferase [Candidatus Halobonum tyrrellensis]|uniref:GNAT family acetyltransferase n=1 Tax=Candidatus Halobonum tyrrellensis G22 TaxID=1324957 RepID=V4GRU5_9EURY|nr:GNAT family N-acetyltransferase [Candidatus Halobonum tyrrellensis]ESP87776.1 GNAT family acetyltransferase [Candidatus Halobonum tyrrellensis G22]